MSFFEALALGIVQGATEFLPVSSSAHLILVPKIFGWTEQPLVFDTTMHIGTSLALIFFFWRDLWEIASALIQDLRTNYFRFSKYSSASRIGLYIFIAILPAELVGLFFDDFIEETFRSVNYVVLFLILGTLLMFTAQKFFNRLESKGLTYKSSLLVGMFQVLAFLPGFSRSGSTISGGMILGLTKDDAARFSFLMSVPITLEAALYQLFKHGFSVEGVTYSVLLVGLLSSMITGLVCIKFLLDYLKRKSLSIFIYYRLFLVFTIIILLGLNS